MVLVVNSLLQVGSIHFPPICDRSDLKAGREEEAAFLTNLSSLWRGLIHMTSVAKFMTKAFIVSGILDNLTEVKWTPLNILRYGKLF